MQSHGEGTVIALQAQREDFFEVVAQFIKRDCLGMGAADAGDDADIVSRAGLGKGPQPPIAPATYQSVPLLALLSPGTSGQAPAIITYLIST